MSDKKNWDKLADILESRDEFEKASDELTKLLVGNYISQFSSNGRFLTKEEFEENRAYITSVHHYIRKMNKQYSKLKK